MSGKYLYKKTSLSVAFFCLLICFGASHAMASSTDRQTLLVEFLRLTDQQPQWLSFERLEKLESGLQSLEDDGLNPSHYQFGRIQRLVQQRGSGANLDLSPAEDAVISGAYLEALADLKLGRTRHKNVENYLDFRQHQPDALSAVVQLAIAYLDQPDKAFDQARPQMDGYRQLRLRYTDLRQRQSTEPVLPAIEPHRPSLRVGMTDPRVRLLRQHLSLPTPEQDADYFEDSLALAVAQYQSQHGLQADGIAGPQTLSRLNRTVQQDLDAIRINLERWRRVNLALTDHRVVVDIAGATLRYYQNGERVLDTRTQVGRRDRPTPLMLSEISHFTLNPTWTIPPTIYRNDKLPAIRRDPGYLQSNRLTVLDPQGNRLDPESIDWDNPGHILLRQAAGPHNALGQVAIRFPNRQSIYLHDTPNQQLFDRSQRYFSSGCVRVEGATYLVEQLLQATGSPAADDLESLLSSGITRNVSIGIPVTIVLGYWTAEVNTQGELQIHADPYGLDPILLAALNN